MKKIIFAALAILATATVFAQEEKMSVELEPLQQKRLPSVRIEGNTLVISGTRAVPGTDCKRAPATWRYALPTPPPPPAPPPAPATIDNSVNNTGDRSVVGNINNSGVINTGDIVINFCCPEPSATPATPKEESSLVAGPFIRVMAPNGPIPTGGQVGVFAELSTGKKSNNPQALRGEWVVGTEIYLRGLQNPESEDLGQVSDCDTCGVAFPYDPKGSKGGGVGAKSAFYGGGRVSKSIGNLTLSIDLTARYDGGLKEPQNGFSVGPTARASYDLGNVGFGDTSVFVQTTQRFHPWAGDQKFAQGNFALGAFVRF